MSPNKTPFEEGESSHLCETETEHDPILMGEVAQPNLISAAPARKSGGGVTAVLSLLIPVVLGGVTVFGVYFFFLEDLLNKPPQPAKAQPPEKSAEVQAIDDPESQNEAPPNFVRPRPKISAVPVDADTEKALPTEPVKTAAEKQTERELAAKRALGLAVNMSARNLKAAEKWYRKVVQDYPNTQAAHEAENWLKKRLNP